MARSLLTHPVHPLVVCCIATESIVSLSDAGLPMTGTSHTTSCATRRATWRRARRSTRWDALAPARCPPHVWPCKLTQGMGFSLSCPSQVNAAVEDAATMAEGVARLLAAARAGGAMPAPDRQRAQMLMVNVQVQLGGQPVSWYQGH